jgi:hypothetical protein
MPEERITWDGVYDMMQLGRDLGAGFVEFIPIRPAGRAVIACSHSELRRHDVNHRMFKTFTKILFFITAYFTISYKMPELEKLTDILLKGCRLVVGVPRKLM